MSSRAENRQHHHHNHNQDRWPNNPNDRNTSNGGSNSLGTAAIVFISIGGVTVLIVVLVCIVLWIRSSRRKPDYRAPRQVVGRGIQRPSFLPFRSFRRHHNEPEIIYYPSPVGSSINYPIETPYTFPSTLTLTSQTGSPKPVRAKIFTNTTPSKPSRATIV